MEHLIFVCPATGREIDSGVGSEIGTLLRIRQQNMRALCPACGAWQKKLRFTGFFVRARIFAICSRT